MKITKPGIYEDLPAADYHAQHEWLSWSMMKRLVPPSTPAHLKTAMRAPEARKRHFDLGKVVHHIVLGKGDMFEVVQSLGRDKKTARDAENYQTVSAQADRDRIYGAGNVPILRDELDQAEQMASAVWDHPAAHALLSEGIPEVSLFWVDEATGVKCRARLDWCPTPPKTGRLVVPDLKTANSAAPSEFQKVAARLGYYGQQEHYSDGIRATGLSDDPGFVFVVVETTDPWPVIVGQFETFEDKTLGAAVVDRCRRVWHECVTTDTWPAYPPGVIDLTLPTWLHWDLAEFSGVSLDSEIRM